jgi:hypothetical protein
VGGHHPSGSRIGFASSHAALAHTGIGMKQAAERAPIWIIAIMAHVALAGVFAVTYIRHDAVASQGGTFTISPSDQGPKLDDPIIVDLPRDAWRLPKVREDPVDPKALFGDPTGFGRPASPDAPTDEGGQGGGVGADLGSGSGPDPLTGALGLGHGSGIGGGNASRGIPLGLNPRIARIDQTAARFKAQPVVKGGLRWLLEHQSDDGMWDCDGFHLRCDPRRGSACGGAGGASHDVGVTALALLAFFGAGHDGRGESPNDEAVRKGIKWLRANQDAAGCFGPQIDKFTYSHACATIAMCEAAMYTKKAEWRRSAQAAVRFIEACQNPQRGWRYGVRPRESDASVTGWMLLALKAGKDAGLEVSDRAIQDGLKYLDTLTDPTDGRTGYQHRGELPVRPEGFAERWPARESESLTAVSLCARIFCGSPDYAGIAKSAAEVVAKRQPVWDESRGSIDMYYWYYATLAMHQLGGPAWEQWNKSLEKAVIESQVKEGCAEGSWDPKDPWGAEGGRVYSTALMTLCFEVYWRYPLVFGGRK